VYAAAALLLTQRGATQGEIDAGKTVFMRFFLTG
jgi:hypothetical protein